MKIFYDSIKSLENMIIDSVHEQSESIFGSKMTREELVPMFNSNMKESPGREPKFRVKVDTTMEDQIKATVFDSVYFLNRKFGCTWKLHQLIVYEPQNLKGFQFKI